MKTFRLLRAQAVVIAIGALFAWYTVVTDFLRFADIEGTIFRVKDCAIPNPVTTPCFWGAWAFLVALVWSVTVIKMNNALRQKKHQLWLVLFLVVGNIFAWSNAIYGIVSFYKNQSKPTIGCSGLLVTNPFATPCFYGSSFFLAALVVSIVTLIVFRQVRK